MIKYQKYNLNKILLTNEVLNSFIFKFLEDVFELIIKKDTKHLMIICKVKYSDNDGGYKTLGPLRKVNYNDKELFSDYLQERLGLLIDSYQPLNMTQIVFTYIIKDGEAIDSDRMLLSNFTAEEDIPLHTFNKIKLPVSMHPSEYGNVIGSTVFDTFTRYFVTDNKRVFQIDVNLDGLTNNVTILGPSDFKWTDTRLDNENPDYFKREIGKSTIYFLNGVTILEKRELNAKTFRKVRS
jgi:hypothetical protein